MTTVDVGPGAAKDNNDYANKKYFCLNIKCRPLVGAVCGLQLAYASQPYNCK